MVCSMDLSTRYLKKLLKRSFLWKTASFLCIGPLLSPPLSENEKVTLLIAFICVRSSPWISQSAYRYFEVVTICNLIMILAFYLVHLFRLYRVLTCISWPLSIFGFVATFLCLASVWLSYKISCVTQSTDAAV
ncbi:PREDICTED: CKLF-like MARVEL transmembrane domain-containing protein 7 isoform X3 [Miniopterus natalensis]|uniref:CKLF-like MARVEL transmembrane domain-containing protein 7 isoform X3 n=1 Tax=Miniopterus natalensis TaxID=291302 RepID=UPI0007A6CD0A|nr:PREDICTED: CKLF-like MARVEL transmembrane domain-containing protein 7 isoform X3 [Miniopterus natalensis]